MELAEPSIGKAVAKCASEGYKKVVIAPYFLSRGRHITTDIPAMVAEAQKAHPEVVCVIAEPIGDMFNAHYLYLCFLAIRHACQFCTIILAGLELVHYCCCPRRTCAAASACCEPSCSKGRMRQEHSVITDLMCLPAVESVWHADTAITMDPGMLTL